MSRTPPRRRRLPPPTARRGLVTNCAVALVLLGSLLIASPAAHAQTSAPEAPSPPAAAEPAPAPTGSLPPPPSTGLPAAAPPYVGTDGVLSPPRVLPPPTNVRAKAPPPKERRPDELFLIRPVLGVFEAGLSISPRGNSDRVVTWSPNSSMKVGARAGYGPFLATATVDWQPAEDPETHGVSRGLDIGFTGTVRMAGHEIASTVFFQRYSGYYLSTTKDLFPNAETPLLAPRLSLTTYGISFLFFTDPKFSYDDAFVEYRPKEKGEASLGLRLGIGRFAFDSGPNSLIPGKFERDFGEAFGLNKLDATYASVGFGGAADWRPFGRMLIAVSGFLGVTVAATHFVISGYDRRSPTTGPSVSVQGVLGYAGDLFHWGVMTSADSESLIIQGSYVQANRASGLLFLGLTF